LRTPTGASGTTSEGRLLAVILMGAGICLVGVLSGMVASWFLSTAAHKAEAEREELKVLIASCGSKA
jgi:hypothetical protein